MNPEIEARLDKLRTPFPLGRVGMRNPTRDIADLIGRPPKAMRLEDMLHLNRRVPDQIIRDHARITELPWWKTFLNAEWGGLDRLRHFVSYMGVLKEHPNIEKLRHYVIMYWRQRNEVARKVYREYRDFLGEL